MKPKAKPAKSVMGRPPTGATFQGISVRFQEAPDNEIARLDSVVAASGLSRAAFIQRATMEKVDAALKSGRLETKVPKFQAATRPR